MKDDGDAIEQHLDISQRQKVSPAMHRGKVQDGDLDRGGRRWVDVGGHNLMLCQPGFPRWSTHFVTAMAESAIEIKAVLAI
jgi:hypothetical protein